MTDREFETGEHVILHGTVIAVAPDPNYPGTYMYYVQIAPSWDEVVVRGDMVDKMEVVHDPE